MTSHNASGILIFWEKNMQVMIMVSEAGRMENTCNLPADLDKNGNVLKIYDYSLKELTINLDGTVTYNGKRWTFDKKQNYL